MVADGRRTVVISAVALLLLTVIGLSIGSALIWREQGRTDRERRLLAANLTLALESLDQVYLTVAEDRLKGPAEVNPPATASCSTRRSDSTSSSRRTTTRTPASGSKLARAYSRAADIRAFLGEDERARGDYGRAIDLLGALIAEFRNDVATRELLRDCFNLADLRRAGGPGRVGAGVPRGGGPVRCADQGLPDEHARDLLAKSYSGLASFLRETGRAREADGYSGRALALHDSLSRQFPGHAEYQETLAQSYINQGTGSWSDGDKRSAAVSFGKARAILERLNEGMDLRELLAVCCHNLSVVLGDDESAEHESLCRRAIALREDLAREHPQFAYFQSTLAHSYDQLGILLAQGGRVEPAERIWGQSLDLFERLVKQDPDVPEHAADLASTLNNLATA